MVDHRLLTRLLVCALALVSSACIGVHIGPVSGRVIDARTGAGVSGVEIFRRYPLTQVQVIGEVGGRGGFTPDWTTSGPKGEFSFPGRWVFEVGAIDHSPLIYWIHRDFGWDFVDTEELDSRRLEIRLTRDDQKVAFFKGAGALESDEPCFGLRDDAPYARCREVVAESRGRRQ